MLKAVRFRVRNFRNIDDSEWVPIERVTALVGRNESGKTALLKALHKFNPATAEPYNAQREFPRDRFTHDFKSGADWPVCSVAFEIAGEARTEIAKLLKGKTPPVEAICTRYYDASLKIEFHPAFADEPIVPGPAIQALKVLAAAARRLQAPDPVQEEATQTLRTTIASWASSWEEKLGAHGDLRGAEGVKLLTGLRKESEVHAKPQTAEIVEALNATIDPMIEDAKQRSPAEQAVEVIKKHLPVFIYFEDYGILDSAIYLPHFLEELNRGCLTAHASAPVNAMFKHVRLTAQEIAELGREEAQAASA